MILRKAEWFILIVAAIAFITGALAYPNVPPLVASHWDAAGNVNGYMSRAWGVFLFPIIFLVVFAIFLIIPRIDPKKENIAKFRKYFDHFIMGFALFFYYVYLLFLAWNMGYRFNFAVMLTPALALLFYLIGVLLTHTELNWTIGIRTPWTISSEAVWRKTHDAGGTAFKVCAAIALVGTFFPGFSIWFVLAPLIISMIGLVTYSYVLFEREKKGIKI